MSDLISVCIPAFQSSAWIEETLSSLLSQTYLNFEAILSIDGNDQQTYEKCKALLFDERFQCTVQKERLGWVENTNWALSKAQGEYLMVLPHDDLIHPEYLERLHGYLLNHPQCSLVYSDIQSIGEYTDQIIQFSLKGSLFRRQKKFIKNHFNAVGFRGLIPKWVLTYSGFLSDHFCGGFAADTIWMAKLAKVGELHRIPKILYWKRYHGKNTHTEWKRRSYQEQRDAWCGHCVELYHATIDGISSKKLQEKLLHAIKKRLIKGPSKFHASFPSLSKQEKLELQEQLLSKLSVD